MSERKRFRAVIEFEGYDGEVQRKSGLPPLDERIRECIETHPIASFPIDSVTVSEIVKGKPPNFGDPENGDYP